MFSSILIIDESWQFRMDLASKLRDLDHDVSCICKTNLIADWLRRISCDLIVLGHDSPSEHLLNAFVPEKYRRIPFVIVSQHGCNDEMMQESVRLSGARAFISKQESLENIVRHIHRLLEALRRPAAA